jgi:quinol-cytochrome oxidoreductase complex cytochrome b subunit
MTATSAIKVIGTTIAVTVGLLAVSGALLVFIYRPNASAFGVVGSSPGLTRSNAARALHRLASWALQLEIIALLVTVFVERLRLRVRAAGALLATAIVAMTGYLLPWDNLAVWAVAVDTNIQGYGPLLGDKVRFVLIGGSELTNGTVLGWLATHIALGVALGVLLIALARRVARAEPPVPTMPPPPPGWIAPST